MDTLFNNLDLFALGFQNTLLLFAVSAVFALGIGIVVGAMRVSPVPVMRAFGTLYVNLVRNTPLTLLMFFFAFGYPKLHLVQLPYTTLAIIALSIYTATYVAEVLRSGFNTVPTGQAEAARAIGLPFAQTMTLVIMPQAFRAVIPPMMSVFIALLKNTTVAAGFSVAEAGAIRANLSERGEPAIVVLLWVALFFVILVGVLSVLQRYLERRWKVLR
ncbi:MULTISPECIES: amino acid ABC transporter permease [Cryobacterium]|uniref:Amino acid ABC transporter permease n=1 Tax=Cryobacterium mannosilyticum TaxID=1259190 RepID=A0A4R8W5P8_9MICO|nr:MULTISPECIES: amino acid ABC transporter permease [Cryobacterium]MBG6057483.1 His/Glu/Gln/Arg/opine family amino acid ABC transporter permease subunit [Cryobacterium sp. MP_M3]MEC5175682.1 glutamate transport system permease protein [Cryobacterium sp. MP_M5]TFB95447.1 amino acid ABC transporter permease [Cryobacterium sp. HLT2-28]TFC00899.1 amino acid ABC transporter permease [Cryobacterium mannosilyticum]